MGAQIIKELKIKDMILVSRSKKRIIALKGYGIKNKKTRNIKNKNEKKFASYIHFIMKILQKNV